MGVGDDYCIEDCMRLAVESYEITGRREQSVPVGHCQERGSVIHSKQSEW